MLKVIIKTKTPDWCIVRSCEVSRINIKHAQIERGCIKALTRFTRRERLISQRCPLVESIIRSDAIV